MKTTFAVFIPLTFALCIDAYADIIIDHRCTDVSGVPKIWISRAKDNLRVGYTHTSHGSQLISGAQAMMGGPDSTFYYMQSAMGPVPGIFMNDHWAAYQMDLGTLGNLTWRDSTISKLELTGNDRNVVMWAWCSGVDDYTIEGINTYLGAMDSLERRYPGVKFVYMTCRLDGGGVGCNLYLGNEQIRAYCRANNKILYDFADIESFDPDGTVNYMPLKANENCDYDSDSDGIRDKNWAAEWTNSHPSSELVQQAAACAQCAHTQNLNCILKARAFWWMMARLAGWDGSVQGVHEESRSESPQRWLLHECYPNPFNPGTTVRYEVAIAGRVSIKILNVLGKEIATLQDSRLGPGSYEVTWNASDFASGVYFCRMETDQFVGTRKVLLIK